MPVAHIVSAPIQGTVVSIDVRPGDVVRRRTAGRRARVDEDGARRHRRARGVVDEVAVGDRSGTVRHGRAVADARPCRRRDDDGRRRRRCGRGGPRSAREPISPQVLDRHERTRDHRRPDAVARRHGAGQPHGAGERRRPRRRRIVRRVRAARRRRAAPAPLARGAHRAHAGRRARRRRRHGGRSFRSSRCRTTTRCSPARRASWDHEKKDRLFELAERRRLPVVFFTEGGGGRPGDTDGLGVSGLDCLAFNYFARLSGLVPLVGITSGYCFAGNAAILGCCDVDHRVAEGSNIGMGGPGDDRRRRPRRLRADRDRAVRRAGRQRCHRRRGRRRSRSGDGGEAVPLVLPAATVDELVVRRPATAAPPRSREPLARVRRARRDRRPVRHRFGARAAPRIRRRGS